MNLRKENNQLNILNAIFDKQVATRANLSRMLGISKPTIAYHLTDLLNLGLVQEVGEGKPSKAGGRKPMLLRFNKEYGDIVSIDLNYSDPTFAIGNLNGEIYNQFTVKMSEQTTASKRLELIKNAIQVLLDSKNTNEENLICIAIASPGIFYSSKKYSLVNPQFREWFKIDLANLISEEFHVDTILENDVNMAAYGEFNSITKENENIRNMIYVSCGKGIGSGLILNSKLYEGSFNSAGEIFNFINSSGLASGQNLEKRISIDGLISSLPKINDFKTVVKEYNRENPMVIDRIRQIGSELGSSISNIANLLSLDTVIIGGEYSVFSDILLEEIEKVLKSYCLFPPALLPSTLGRYAGVMGLFSVARQRFFESIVKKEDNEIIENER
ncbi:MAG: ROK family protein [Anaerovoracaceae bacterium]|jgi:predicted NBD/HSP70 family sugar kinase